MTECRQDVKVESSEAAAPVPGGLTGPGAYARWRASTLGGVTEALEQRRIHELMGPVAGTRVLDLGSGDGLLTTTLATLGASAVGVDLDRAMLRVASARSAQGPGQPARYVEGQLERLPFRDAAFDVVVAVTVLCLVSDRAAALQEAARVLRPGGRLIVGDLGRWNLWAAKRRIKGWLGSRLWRSAHFSSATDLVRVVQQAGFAIDAVRGSVFYPPVGVLARPMACLDRWIGSVTTIGAAFIAIAATKGRE